MNTHENARPTFVRRQDLVRDMIERQLTPAVAGAEYKVSAATARKWPGRFLAQGGAGLRDASSRPRVSPHAIPPERGTGLPCGV